MQYITSVHRSSLQAGNQDKTHTDVQADQRCQTIAYKRKGRAGIRQNAAGNADIDKTLNGNQGTDPRAEQGS